MGGATFWELLPFNMGNALSYPVDRSDLTMHCGRLNLNFASHPAGSGLEQRNYSRDRRIDSSHPVAVSRYSIDSCSKCMYERHHTLYERIHTRYELINTQNKSPHSLVDGRKDPTKRRLHAYCGDDPLYRKSQLAYQLAQTAYEPLNTAYFHADTTYEDANFRRIGLQNAAKPLSFLAGTSIFIAFQRFSAESPPKSPEMRSQQLISHTRINNRTNKTRNDIDTPRNESIN